MNLPQAAGKVETSLTEWGESNRMEFEEVRKTISRDRSYFLLWFGS
jgi:hypothetical protein